MVYTHTKLFTHNRETGNNVVASGRLSKRGESSVSAPRIIIESTFDAPSERLLIDLTVVGQTGKTDRGYLILDFEVELVTSIGFCFELMSDPAFSNGLFLRLTVTNPTPEISPSTKEQPCQCRCSLE